ncbi:MAG: hypothetical protein Q9200_000604, partial [Gallowayella weberi]
MDQSASDPERHRAALLPRVASPTSPAARSQRATPTEIAQSSISTTQSPSQLLTIATPLKAVTQSTISPASSQTAESRNKWSNIIPGPSQSDDPRGVPIAAVVGGIFAGILLTMITAFGIWMFAIRNNVLPPIPAVRSTPATAKDTWTKPELDDTYRAEMDGVAKDHLELEAGDHKELEGRSEATAELGREGKRRFELLGNLGMLEMEGWVPGELEG